MAPKPKKEIMAAMEAARRAAGLKKFSAWCTPKEAEELRRHLEKLRNQ